MSMQSFIVTLRSFIGERPGDASAGELNYDSEEYQQFWADDTAHAGEQADDANPYCAIIMIETQAEHEERTGVKLDY